MQLKGRIFSDFLFLNFSYAFILIYILFILTVYFDYFTKIKPLNLIKNTIIFKIVFTVINYLLEFFSFTTLLWSFNYLILFFIFLSIYLSKKRVYFFLKIVYIITFWSLLSEILSFNFWNIQGLDSPFLLAGLSCFASHLVSAFEFSDLPDPESNDNFNIIPSYSSSDENIPNKQVVSAKNFNSKIDKLNELLKPYLERKEGWGPNNPYDFLKWIIASGYITEDKAEELKTLLKSEMYEEFYSKIPKKLVYGECLNETYIFNGAIYLTEFFAKFILDSNQDNAASFLKNQAQEAGDISFLSAPLIDGTAQIKPVLNSEGEKVYFFCYISDLFNSALKTKYDIDINNKKIIKFDEIKESALWDYFKKYIYHWFIELNVFTYINGSYFFSHNTSMSDFTLGKYMFSAYSSVWEHVREYDILIKSKIWYEHDKGIKFSDLSESTLNEYKELFIKYWLYQILSYNRIDQISVIDAYNENMYDLNILYLELLENILFVQCKILEAYLGIDTVNHFFNSSSLKEEDLLTEAEESVARVLKGKGELYSFKSESDMIFLYNYLYENYKIEIYDKNKDVYDLRREYIVEKYRRISHNDLVKGYEYVLNFDNNINYNSKLNKDNFHKCFFNPNLNKK